MSNDFPTYNEVVAKALPEHTRRSPFAALLGIEIAEVRPGAIRCRLPLDPKHQSGVGAVHGGAIISLIDHALSLAVYPLVEIGKWVATLEFKVNYLAPVFAEKAGGYIEAEAVVLSLKKRVATVRIDVRTASGELVASAQGTDYIREQPGA